MKSKTPFLPKWAIIILNWNNAKDTLECLQSLEKIQYPHFEVILIDNGSSDHSLEKIRHQYPDLLIIPHRENLGFAEGNNHGLKAAKERKAEMILLLNNDTVVAPNVLLAFSKAAQEHPKAAVFGAKIYYYDDPATLWYAGGEVNTKTGRCFHVGCGQADIEKKYTQISDTGYACGCALALRESILEKVGFLNPKYFLIWEEIDFCWRIKKAGFSCLFVPQAKVWHKVSSSFIEGNRGPMWQYYYFRNRILFLKEHNKKGAWRIFLFFEILHLCASIFYPKTPSAFRKQTKAALLGVWDAFWGNFGKGRLAKFIQK